MTAPKFTELIIYSLLLSEVTAAKEVTSMTRVLSLYLSEETCDIFLLPSLLPEEYEQLHEYNAGKTFFPVTDWRFEGRHERQCKVAVARELDPRLRNNPLVHNLFLLTHGSNKFNDVSLAAVPKTVVTFTYDENQDVVVRKSCGRGNKVKLENLFSHRSKSLITSPSADFCPSPLRGKDVTVSIKGLAPFVLYTKPEITGTDPAIIDILSDKMGFSFEYSHEETWGNPIGNTGEFSGIIGKVKNGSSEFGIGSISMVNIRFNVVDYSTPLYTLNMHFYATKPKPKSIYMNFLKPFSLPVWLLLLSVFLVVLAGSLLTIWVVHGKNHDYVEAVLLPYGHILEQTKNINSYMTLSNPWFRPSFVFSWIWLIFVTFIILSYQCNLRAYLMQVEYERPLDTAEDLLELDMDLFVPLGTHLISLFKTSPNPELQAIHERVQGKNSYFSFVNGLPDLDFERKLIVEGGAMIFGEAQAYANLAWAEKRHGFVPFRVGKSPILEFYCGVVMPKGAPWKSEVDSIILRLNQGGIIEKIMEDFINPKYLTETPPDTSPVPFRVDTILGLIFVLATGIIMAVLVFLFELVKPRNG